MMGHVFQKSRENKRTSIRIPKPNEKQQFKPSFLTCQHKKINFIFCSSFSNLTDWLVSILTVLKWLHDSIVFRSDHKKTSKGKGGIFFDYDVQCTCLVNIEMWYHQYRALTLMYKVHSSRSFGSKIQQVFVGLAPIDFYQLLCAPFIYGSLTSTLYVTE